MTASRGDFERPADDRRAALTEALRKHHPIMRSETGPFSGCRCGGVRIGQDVIAHVLAALLPVVEQQRREAAAEALEEAANWLAGPPTVAEHGVLRRAIVHNLRDRAAALADNTNREGNR